MKENEEEHLNPTDEITLDVVKQRAVKGILVLTGRTFFLSFISLAATAFLTVFLAPSDFGVFWIVSAIVNFLSYFSDVGLAAALIQKKEKPEKEDLYTTFTIQQILVLLILIVLYFATPYFIKTYNLSIEGKYLLYALGASLFMSSLKTIPSALMERKLEFNKLVIPQIFENLIYNLVAVFLAWKGFGITSFTIAVLLRGIVGLVAIYILNPWVPGIAFCKNSLKKLLSYGLPYQANSLLATIKDDGMTAMLGGILGPAGIGFLGWAQKWAYTPLRFFMDHTLKVTFPAFSRMQDEKSKEHLERSLTRSIFFICVLVFPSVVGFILVAPVLVHLIPRYEKWLPALIPLYLISINAIFAAVTTQLTNLLNAIGKIKITFFLMIMWTVLTWILIPFLASKMGLNGAALGYTLVGSSSIVAIFIARKYVKFSFLEAVVRPFAATLVMGIVLFLIRMMLPYNWFVFGLLIIVGMIVYIFSIYLLVGVTLIQDAKKSFQTFFSK